MYSFLNGCLSVKGNVISKFRALILVEYWICGVIVCSVFFSISIVLILASDATDIVLVAQIINNIYKI